jgi:hypothetical protein
MPVRLKPLRCLLLLAIAGVAGAQSDFEVTMRVVEDTRGLNAALIVIGADVVETRAEPGSPAPAQ